MPLGSGINADQREVLLQKVLQDARKLFTKGEKHICCVVQQKPIINMLPHSVIITNKRIIKHTPKLLGSRFKDYLWKDLKNVHLTEKLLGVELLFEFENETFVLDKLPKNQAKKVYTLAQEREEEWIEKRRMRHIEEDRAKSGGTYLNMRNGGSQDIKTKLLEIKSLFDEGLITQDEYQRKKADVLKEI